MVEDWYEDHACSAEVVDYRIYCVIELPDPTYGCLVGCELCQQIDCQSLVDVLARLPVVDLYDVDDEDAGAEEFSELEIVE